MNVSRKIKNLLFLLIILFIPLIAKALDVKSGSFVSAGLGDWRSVAHYKYVDETIVLCTQFDKTFPTSCSSSTKLGADVNAGVGRIVEWYNSGGNYVCAEKLITKFMFNHYSKTGRTDYSLVASKSYENGKKLENWVSACGADELNRVYSEAETRYKRVNKIPKLTFGSNSLNFSQSGNDFVASVALNSDGYDVSCGVNYGTFSISDGIVTVTVDKSNYGKNITLTCNTTYTYNSPTKFYNDCKGNQQTITSSLESVTVEGEKNSISGSFENPTPYYYLDLNGYLDGQQTWHIKDYGTADIYINGTLIANDVNDYWGMWPSGTTYEITDIKPQPGKQYNGVYSGNIIGTITANTQVYLNFSTLGSLKIKKTNSSNDALAQLTSTTTAKFRLYNNSSCTGEVLKDFKAGETVSNLQPGTYYLKEYQAKTGYHLPQFGEKWYCEPITIKVGSNEITVENKTVCEYEFRNNMTMKERIDLYNSIKTNYSQEFNGLLDMSNTTSKLACKNIPITKNYDKSCLQASSTSTNQQYFSNTNLSMYTEKYGSYTFCLTKYNLVNNLGKTKFTGIKSGQAIISTDDVVATATLNRVCYNFGDTNTVNDKYNNFKYSNYIEDDASIDGTKLIKSETISGTDDNKTITVTYTLPVMYASNKDGRIYYGYCKEGEFCKELGKGIISKFNLKPNTYDLKFDIKLKEEELGKLNTSSDCKYTTENELIDYKNNLALEFRTVKTNSDNAFLSKDGTSNREIGSNWSNEEDRKTVLIDHNDSYNKNNEDPLYTITLTPSIIKEIREDNKSKSYDDYNMTCIEDGTICISNYLTCLQSDGILQIKERENIDKFRPSEIVCKY